MFCGISLFASKYCGGKKRWVHERVMAWSNGRICVLVHIFSGIVEELLLEIFR